MADVVLHVADGQAGALQRVADRFLEASHRELVDLAAVHAQVAEADRVGFVARRNVAVELGVVERAPEAAVAVHLLVLAALLRVGVGHEDRGTRAVAEDDRDGAIAPVDEAREHLDADHGDLLGAAAADHGVRHVHPVEEAAACGGQVEDRRLACTHGLADAGGGGRADHLAADARDDDHVEFLGLHARALERLQQGIAPQREDGLGIVGLVARADAGALRDPFVARVDDLLEVLVGDHARRDRAPRPRDPHATPEGRVHASTCSTSLTVARRATIFSLIFASANALPRRIAFLMVRSLLEPWLMSDTPLTPRSGAPPYSW